MARLSGNSSAGFSYTSTRRFLACLAPKIFFKGVYDSLKDPRLGKEYIGDPQLRGMVSAASRTIEPIENLILLEGQDMRYLTQNQIMEKNIAGTYKEIILKAYSEIINKQFK